MVFLMYGRPPASPILNFDSAIDLQDRLKKNKM
jgi:hypothetical protein